ncbi:MULTISPECIES: SdpI family protein [unclassified Flavobacterium]|uniref:SdpI family protein n=1 Tax=unclassified Flavobacterium TaxID=196869 RepID=UPI003F907C0C
MKLTFKNELPLIGIVLAPFVYLSIIWDTLPEKIPTHWNYKGEIDKWGDKYSLIILLFLLPVLSYVLMLVIPKIDPKKKMEQMRGKYYQLKFILVLFMSTLAFVILYLTQKESTSSPNLIYILIGILFIALGNYFKVIQPNYFIGIKTPWTLENKEVWKLTHTLAGKLWILGGLIIVIGSLVIANSVFIYVFGGVVAIISLVPIVYSYLKFKELKKQD